MNKLAESDIAWTEERAIELMATGLSLPDAIKLAARECSQRVVDRAIRRIIVLDNERDRFQEERRKKHETEEAARRAEMTARATPAQRPTLKVSLGDLLAKRKER